MLASNSELPNVSKYRNRTPEVSDSGIATISLTHTWTLMISSNPVVTRAGTDGLSTRDPAVNRPGVISLLLLTAWCGLVAGLLEVGTTVLRKHVFDPNQLYKLSRHFVWLIPLSNVAVFLALGLLGSGVVLMWPRRGRWLFLRVLGAMALLPALWLPFHGSTDWHCLSPCWEWPYG